MGQDAQELGRASMRNSLAKLMLHEVVDHPATADSRLPVEALDGTADQRAPSEATLGVGNHLIDESL